jgi:adenylate cyclase
LFVFGRTVSALARRVPFLLYLALRSLGYLTAILMGLAVSAWLVRESAESEPLIERGGVIFSIALSLGANLLYGVNNLLGQGVLFNFVAGRYRRPRIEERVLLFIDMESSTVIAERLGETGFLDFLNRFVSDVTGSIVAQRGVIHKYVGDEIIATWPLAAGGTGTASAPASTRWSSWTNAPTPTFATSASGQTSAPRFIAGPWSLANSAPSRWKSRSSATP